LITALVLTWSGPVSAQSEKLTEDLDLPPCPGIYDKNTWTDCIGSTILLEGTTLINTGDHYQGAWKNGKPEGKGVLTGKKNGNFRYVGEFKSGGSHGKGTFHSQGEFNRPSMALTPWRWRWNGGGAWGDCV
ncbi:MAG: hypothetical protein QGF09_12730, partial [Rhodospirillales bacterium]|nr:hypothetical protein [Rhodospirillales bacterium]